MATIHPGLKIAAIFVLGFILVLRNRTSSNSLTIKFDICSGSGSNEESPINTTCMPFKAALEAAAHFLQSGHTTHVKTIIHIHPSGKKEATFIFEGWNETQSGEVYKLFPCASDTDLSCCHDQSKDTDTKPVDAAADRRDGSGGGVVLMVTMTKSSLSDGAVGEGDDVYINDDGDSCKPTPNPFMQYLQ